MQGVELLIAVVSSWQLNWVYWEVFECMIEDNLMDKCVVVLKLMSDAVFKHGRAVITVDNAMENCGFIGDKWKGNACEPFMLVNDIYCGTMGLIYTLQ